MFKNLAHGAVGLPASTLDEAIHYAITGGFSGFDLNLKLVGPLVAADGTAAVKAKLAAAGLRFGGWSLPTNWRQTDAAFYESLAQLHAQAELAAGLECFRTYTWVSGWSDELTRQEQFDRLVHRFGLIAEILDEYGHTLGLEFIGPHTSRAKARYGCVYTMDAMLAIACAIGTGNVGLLLDCWHWYTAQSTLTDLKQLIAEEVVYVHVNDAPAGVPILEHIDNQRALPGETGVIDIGGFLAALHKIGYDGPVTPEPFSKPLNGMADKEEAARLIGRTMDDIWTRAGLA